MGKRKSSLLAKATLGVLTAAMAFGTPAMTLAEEGDGQLGTWESVLLTDANEGVEYTEPTTETAYAVMNLDPLARATQLTWTVLGGNRLESEIIYIKSGQYLRMAGVGSPDTVSFKFGYTNHKTDWYCTGQSTYSHSFQIEDTGYYRIYFRNLAAFQSVTVTFAYGIYDN